MRLTLSVSIVCVMLLPAILLPAVARGSWTYEDTPLDARGNVDLAFNPADGRAWVSGVGGVYQRVSDPPNNWQLVVPIDPIIDRYTGWNSSIGFAGPNAYGVGATKQHGDLEYSAAGTTQIVRTGRYGYTSLAFKSDGNPALSHCNMDREGPGLHGVEYVEFSGTQWNTPIAVPGEWVSGGTSLAIDTSDRPWIAYTKPTTAYAGNRTNFKVAQYTGTAWNVWTVAADASNGAEESLALDSTGVPVAAWLEYTPENGYSGAGYLSRYTGSAWQRDAMPFASNACDSAALAFDPISGLAAVAYGGLDHNLWLARQTISGWTQERIMDRGDVNGYISVEFTGDGQLAILEGSRYWIPEPGSVILLALGSFVVMSRSRRG